MEPEPHPTPESERLELEHFAGLVGQTFEIRRTLHGEPVGFRVTLIKAEPSRYPRARERFRDPFDLLFELAPGEQLPQLSSILHHPELGEFAALLVPAQPEPGDGALLAATFN